MTDDRSSLFTLCRNIKAYLRQAMHRSLHVRIEVSLSLQSRSDPTRQDSEIVPLYNGPLY